MQDSEKLIEKIIDDANQKKNEILTEAESTADSIISDAREEADNIWNEYKEKVKIDSNDEKKRFEAIEKLEHRKAMLAAKQKVINEAFDKAKKKIQDMDSKEYEQFLLNKIIDNVENGDAEIVIGNNDRSRLSSGFIDKLNERLSKENINSKIEMSKKSRDINSGFVLIYKNSEIMASLEAIIEDKRQELENEVIRILFK